MEYLPGGREAALSAGPRRYTLTHNDVTGSLQLSIGALLPLPRSHGRSKGRVTQLKQGTACCDRRDPAGAPVADARACHSMHVICSSMRIIRANLALPVCPAGREYNQRQLDGWYTRMVRDEILAEWQDTAPPAAGRTCSAGGGRHPRPSLHVFCHVRCASRRTLYTAVWDGLGTVHHVRSRLAAAAAGLRRFATAAAPPHRLCRPSCRSAVSSAALCPAALCVPAAARSCGRRPRSCAPSSSSGR